MSSYVIPVFPAASRVPPRDALSARLAELTGRFAELSSELAAIASAVDSVSGKADKAPPAAAGNLASLDASGNLADSGATPASIKAAAVAEVVANAPGTMDTLKEIADILGSSQESGTVLKRISDLESGKAPAQHVHDASHVTSGTFNAARIPSLNASKIATGTFDPDRIPSLDASKITSGTLSVARLPFSVDATLTTSGAAADAKAVMDVVRSASSGWVFLGVPVGERVDEVIHTGHAWSACMVSANGVDMEYVDSDQSDRSALYLSFESAPERYRGMEAIRGLAALHSRRHAVGGEDPLTPEDIGAASTVDLNYRFVEPSSGYLIDRAVNAVSVTGATTLTLPERILLGNSRDFYVRLTVSAAGDGSAVTFAATDSGGDAVAWDSMGDPSGTFAEGTYLYRMTESDEGLMHAEDMMALEGVEDALEQINDGTSTPSALDMKLDATSAAPAFDPTLTYIVGEYVTYGGILYRCKIAVTVAGPWTGDSNWVDVDMTSPDATLDVRSDGRLAVVAADSEILWIQGYDMASASDVVLSCEKVNFYAFASGTTTQTFNMPSAPGGKVGDFVLDIDNSANASTAATATLNGFGTTFDVIVPKGQNLFTDILTFDGGEMCELYFTMTAFGTAAKPAWKVVKQVVEKQEAGS